MTSILVESLKSFVLDVNDVRVVATLIWSITFSLLDFWHFDLFDPKTLSVLKAVILSIGPLILILDDLGLLWLYILYLGPIPCEILRLRLSHALWPWHEKISWAVCCALIFLHIHCISLLLIIFPLNIFLELFEFDIIRQYIKIISHFGQNFIILSDQFLLFGVQLEHFFSFFKIIGHQLNRVVLFKAQALINLLNCSRFFKFIFIWIFDAILV